MSAGIVRPPGQARRGSRGRPACGVGAPLGLITANALGAWLGALVMAAGWGYQAAGWVGGVLSLGGLAFLGASLVLHRGTARAVEAS